MDFDHYINLANAIVASAAKDYGKVIRRLNKFPNNKEALAEKRSIERFFRSSWFEMLTNLDGEELMKQIRYNERKIAV